VLAGVNVTIQDSEVVRPEDFGINYFLSPDAIGKNTVEASVTKLNALNSFSTIQVVTASISDLEDCFIHNFDVVLYCGNDEVISTSSVFFANYKS
jgi:molybdopterin/thiamine biosynthesis adenylyltransferase